MAMLRNRPRIMNAGDLSPMARGGDSQFVVDHDHPHLRNCTGLFLLDEYESGTLTNHMGGAPATLSGNFWNSQRGLSALKASSHHVVMPPNIIPTSFPISFRFVSQHTTTQSTCYFTLGNTATTTYYCGCWMSSADYGYVIYQEDTPSSKKNIAIGPATLVDGETYEIIGVISDLGHAHLYVNGRNVANATFYDLSFMTFNTFNFCRLERSSSGYTSSVNTQFLQFFDGDIRDTAHDMYEDRYAFIRKPVNNRFFYTAAAPGGFFARRYYDSMIGGKS